MTALFWVVAIVLIIALVVGINCALGFGAAWVLGYFGVHVPWYVCSVAIVILGAVFGSSRVSK